MPVGQFSKELEKESQDFKTAWQAIKKASEEYALLANLDEPDSQKLKAVEKILSDFPPAS